MLKLLVKTVSEKVNIPIYLIWRLNLIRSNETYISFLQSFKGCASCLLIFGMDLRLHSICKSNETSGKGGGSDIFEVSEDEVEGVKVALLVFNSSRSKFKNDIMKLDN